MRTIFVQRIINGETVKWRMDVDENMTVLAEGPADSFIGAQPLGAANREVPQIVKDAPHIHAHIRSVQEDIRRKQLEFRQSKENQLPVPNKENSNAALEAYKQALDSRGIKYKVNEAGQVIVLNVPVIEKQIIQFFDLSQPTPDVPGMEDIRVNYKTELENMQSGGCTTCQINALQRKYRAVLMDTVFKK